MRLPLTLDLHLGNFTYPAVDSAAEFDAILAIAHAAERSGFSSMSLMDHLHQIATNGPPQNAMLEGSTLLSAIAARTDTLTLGLLVGSVTYRNPALAAKITTTIDIVSRGRVWHGLGAGWFEEEHQAYGFAFPPLRERFELLEEALQISRSMFTRDTTAFEGTHFTANGAMNNPRPVRGDIPILVGGSGERKTLRLVATYADGCNLMGDPDRLRHLLGVLDGHCEAVGRDPGEITKTAMMAVAIAPTHEAAQAKLERMRETGASAQRLASTIVGDPDTIIEAAQARRDVGIEGLTVPLAEAWDPATVELAGQALGSVFPRVGDPAPAATRR